MARQQVNLVDLEELTLTREESERFTDILLHFTAFRASILSVHDNVDHLIEVVALLTQILLAFNLVTSHALVLCIILTADSTEEVFPPSFAIRNLTILNFSVFVEISVFRIRAIELLFVEFAVYESLSNLLWE